MSDICYSITVVHGLSVESKSGLHVIVKAGAFEFHSKKGLSGQSDKAIYNRGVGNLRYETNYVTTKLLVRSS